MLRIKLAILSILLISSVISIKFHFKENLTCPNALKTWCVDQVFYEDDTFSDDIIYVNRNCAGPGQQMVVEFDADLNGDGWFDNYYEFRVSLNTSCSLDNTKIFDYHVGIIPTSGEKKLVVFNQQLQGFKPYTLGWKKN